MEAEQIGKLNDAIKANLDVLPKGYQIMQEDGLYVMRDAEDKPFAVIRDGSQPTTAAMPITLPDGKVLQGTKSLACRVPLTEPESVRGALEKAVADLAAQAQQPGPNNAPPVDPGGMQTALEAAVKQHEEAMANQVTQLGPSGGIVTEPPAIDPRGSAFDPRVHAQKEDGSPKTDSFGNFIKRELDYVAHPFAHFADTFRHVEKK